MAITIGSNTDSLRAIRSLNQHSQKISQIYERLASGKRINRASDDPAGLAVASNLQAQQRIATVAIRNAYDGISAISIADGVMSEITNILTRMSELAQQAANGVYTNFQRSALQLEFSALGSEIERLSRIATFNGIGLLDGSASGALQVGLNGQVNSQIFLPTINLTLSALGLASANSASLAFSISATTSAESMSAALQALDALGSAVLNVAVSRGSLGASEARLEVAINSLTVLRENLAAAESRIMDVDVAAEMAELTRLLILQQAGTAILAQINQQRSLVLTLLK